MTRITVTIGIDSDPFQARPDTMLEGVITGTLLDGKDPLDTTSRVFGAWQWEWVSVNEELWAEDFGIVKGRLQYLYSSGRIRGAIHSPATKKEVS